MDTHPQQRAAIAVVGVVVAGAVGILAMLGSLAAAALAGLIGVLLLTCLVAQWLDGRRHDPSAAGRNQHAGS